MSQAAATLTERPRTSGARALRALRIAFRLTFAALGLLALAAAAYFAYEWAYPPAPVDLGHPFFNDDGRRAPRFLMASFRYGSALLLFASCVKGAAAFAWLWTGEGERPGWKLAGALALISASGILRLAAGLSCGC